VTSAGLHSISVTAQHETTTQSDADFTTRAGIVSPLTDASSRRCLATWICGIPIA
jgi:hypothetical protein